MVKVTIVIFNDNTLTDLEEYLESISKQTFDDFEVICAGFENIDISSPLSDRIKFVSHPISDFNSLKNALIENSSGEYVLFTNPDITLYDDSLEKLSNIADLNDSDAIVFKSQKYSKIQDKSINIPSYEINFFYTFKTKMTNYKDIKYELYDFYISPYSMFFKKGLLNEVKLNNNTLFIGIFLYTEIMSQAEKIYFYKEFLNCQNIDYLTNIENCNKLLANDLQEDIKLLDSLNVYENPKKVLFERKIHDVYSMFLMGDNDLKKEFFTNMKRCFDKYQKIVFVDNNSRFFNSRVYHIITYCINLDNYEEFELNINILDQLEEKRRLTLKKERIERGLKNYNALNNELLNSISWKMTKPFRKIRRQ